jgi:hypothetical protein
MAGAGDGEGDGMVDLDAIEGRYHDYDISRASFTAGLSVKDVPALVAEVRALRARVARMEAVMRQAEWVECPEDDGDPPTPTFLYCLVCEGDMPNHEPGCEWVAAMGDA